MPAFWPIWRRLANDLAEPAWGRNKRIRNQIAGYQRVIRKHEDKIAQELQKEAPDLLFLRKWEKDIDRAQKLM